MNSLLLRGCTIAVVAVALAACNANGGSSLPGAISQTSTARSNGPSRSPDAKAVAGCQGSRVGRAQCDVLVRVGAGPNIPGLSPAKLQSAYNLTAASLSYGTGQVVAVVDAYDNPNVASDLAFYRSYFGLPTANFTKYNQLGQTSNYPSGNAGWGVEIDLDVEMVSASCPNCTIYLVEANSNGWSDLQTAEAEAVTLGATIITNSYSGSGANHNFFDTPNKTYLASAGDTGYGIADPADFKTVVSVGGTTLSPGPAPRHWTETIWNGSGAGCSTDPKPSWQTDPGCTHRTANDVSADANPNTGVSEYDSYTYGGWLITWIRQGIEIFFQSNPTLACAYRSKTLRERKRGGLPAKGQRLMPLKQWFDGASQTCPIFNLAGDGTFSDFPG